MAEATSIKKALDAFLKKSGLETLLKNKELCEAWEEVVGREVALQTRIVAFRRGVIYVEVASSGLYAELSTYYSGALTESMREKMGGGAVRAIRFSLAEITGDAKNAEEKHNR